MLSFWKKDKLWLESVLSPWVIKSGEDFLRRFFQDSFDFLICLQESPTLKKEFGEIQKDSVKLGYTRPGRFWQISIASLDKKCS